MSKIVVVKKKKKTPPIIVITPEPEIVEPEPLPEPIPEIVTEAESELEPSPPESEEEAPVPPRPKKRCTWADCSKCCMECIKCPYFPICCNMPLLTVLQFLMVIDMLVALVTIAAWFCLIQYDPLQARVQLNRSASFADADTDTVGEHDITTSTERFDQAVIFGFAESTTELDPTWISDDVDDKVEATRYTKIAYFFLDYQQDVERGCGVEYYAEHLYGPALNRTQRLFDVITHFTIMSEAIEFFIDISFIISTCCFFTYSSARVYIIILWQCELIPVTMKLGNALASKSQALCIFQYGFGPRIRPLNLVLYFHLIPLILLRIYKKIVFGYFIQSIFTATGHITHRTKVLGMTLKDYRQRHREYLEIDKDREELSDSSED